MDLTADRSAPARYRLLTSLAWLLATTALMPVAALAQGASPPPGPPPAGAPAPGAPVATNTAPPPVAPETPAPNALVGGASQTGVVQRIVVQGNVRIEQETILSYLPIQAGDVIGRAQMDLGVKTLFKTDLFSDVSIDLDAAGNLVVRVVENPIINQVVFEGNDNLKDDKLRDEVTVRPRGIFTRGRVQGDVQRIVELYRRSGRIGVTVTPEIVELPQKRVDLIFEINEGPKSGVLRINFLGNKQYSEDDLRGVITTKESRFYRFLSSSDNYDPDRIDYDQEQLRKYYRNHGFYDFRVVNAIAELAPGKNGFALTYTMDEGAKYKFGKLKVETDLKRLNGAVLTQLLPLHTGQMYEDEKIQQSTDALTFAAGAAGFAFVDVVPHYTADPKTHTVDVTFQIKEGPRVYVDRIDIVGNTQTLDPVIRRELMVAEGDAYNRVLVDRSKNQVKALGFFKDVDIKQTPGSAPDRTALQVKVTEQPTGELSFSAGYSSVDRLVLDLGVSQRNFRGRGEDVRAEVSVGSLRQQLQLSFTEPRWLGRNLTAGMDLYAYRYDFTIYSGYDTTSVGAAWRVGFPLSQYMSLSGTYTLHADNVIVDDSLCGVNASVSPILCDERGYSFTSLVGYTFRWDHRNDPINPTRGYSAEIYQGLAGLGGNVKYLKTTINTAWYHGFSPAWILTISGNAGYVNGWGGDTVRINDRFYEGGDSFRGFQVAGLGARDISTASSGAYNQALGNKAYAIGTIEQTFPDFLPDQYGIHMALFSDFGVVGLLDPKDKIYPGTTQPSPNVKDDMAFRASAGISIFWKSPVGPIKIDLSQVLKREPYDITETFKFSTSTRF